MPLIEGGNPTGNPKDQTFFEEARKAPFLTQAVLVPSQHMPRGCGPEEDAGLAALLGTEQPVVSLFGKAGYPAGDGGSACDAAGKPAHDP